MIKNNFFLFDQLASAVKHLNAYTILGTFCSSSNFLYNESIQSRQYPSTMTQNITSNMFNWNPRASCWNLFKTYPSGKQTSKKMHRIRKIKTLWRWCWKKYLVKFWTPRCTVTHNFNTIDELFTNIKYGKWCENHRDDTN